MGFLEPRRPLLPAFRRVNAARAGFTVIELLVVAMIIGALSVIVILGQTSFNRTILLSNTASDIALSLRHAQTYGIGTRGVGVGGVNYSNADFGLYFEGSNSYAFFADTTPNNCSTSYDPTCNLGNDYYDTTDLTVQTYSLNNAMTISNFCGIYILGASETDYCKSGGTATAIGLSIVSKRPNNYAIIRAITSPGVATAELTKACITVKSPEGTTRSIVVTNAGHITDTASCP